MARRIGLALIAAVLTAIGCDNKQTSALPKPPREQMLQRPTTQELIATPFTTLSLLATDMPAKIQIPKGWALTKSDKPANIRLEGFTPTDVVDIGFVPLVTKDALKKQDLIDSTKRMMASDPMTASIPAIRESNGALVIESIDLGNPVPSTAPAVARSSDTPVEWAVMLCVPNEDKFTVYEIRIIGLGRTAFNTDRDFLQKIMGSLSYDPPTPTP